MIAKQKEDDEKRRQDALMRLKLANQRKFTGTLLPSNALYSGDVDVVSFSTGQVPESGMPLFDGQIKPFGAAKPFSDDVFTSGLRAQFSKNSPMARSQFEVYEKHVSAEGKPFFYSPRLKKSVWTLPPCSILVDCTAEDVEGGVSESDKEQKGRCTRIRRDYFRSIHPGIKYSYHVWFSPNHPRKRSR